MPEDELASAVANKFAIVADHRKRTGGLRGDVDVIDISGAVLATSEWADYVADSAARAPLGRWRVLLLEPGSPGAAVRANESTVWNGDQDRMESMIRRRRRLIYELAERWSVNCEIRFYGSVPVSRYMRIGDVVYQSYYPEDRTGRDVAVLTLPAGGILDARARKEFDVLWRSGLRAPSERAARTRQLPADQSTTPSHIGTAVTGSALNT